MREMTDSILLTETTLGNILQEKLIERLIELSDMLN